MKLNKNGWSLAEMLIISSGLLILLFLMAIYIYSFYNKLDFNSSVDYGSLESKLQVAAIRYFEKNDLSYGRVTLNTLKDAGYIDEFDDGNGDSCNGYVIYENHDYHSYISCNNYKSKDYNEFYE